MDGFIILQRAGKKGERMVSTAGILSDVPSSIEEWSKINLLEIEEARENIF